MNKNIKTFFYQIIQFFLVGLVPIVFFIFLGNENDNIMFLLSVMYVFIMGTILTVIEQRKYKSFNYLSELISNGFFSNVDEKKLKGGLISNELIQDLKKIQLRNMTINQCFEMIANGQVKDMNIKLDSKDPFYQSLTEIKQVFEKFSVEVDNMLGNVSIGRYRYIMDDSIFIGVYQNLISKINRTLVLQSEALDLIDTPVFTLNTDFEIQYANKKVSKLLDSTADDLVGSKCFNHFNSLDCGTENCACLRAMTDNQFSDSRTVARPKGFDNLHIYYTGMPLTDSNNKVVGALEYIVDETEIYERQRIAKKETMFQAKEANRLLKNMMLFSEGNFSLDFEETPYDPDLKNLSVTYKIINEYFEKSINMFAEVIAEITMVLSKLSRGNLDIYTNVEYPGALSSIRDSLQNIISSLNSVIKKIIVTSEHVNNESLDVSRTSESLSSGAVQQASAIEEISATVTQVAAQIKDNATNTSNVMSLADENKVSAKMGDSQMNELVESMRKITTSTANIQKVLKMINDIAFQTNILSLNAAVEAARAGQHGKGFAVIAEDVRNLALKSAVAADDTSSMLDEVNLNILQSTEIVQKTAESLAQIVNSTEQTEKLSRDVSHASNEQAIAVNQITLSLEQVSGVVQGTTLSAEKAANTSKLLKESANSLMETISSFETMDEVVNWDAHNLKISKSFDKKKYVWNESFSVDVNTFDNHHIYLFDLVNDLYNAIEKNQDSLEIKSIFYEIYEYTDYHFTEEEKAMKESNVPNLDAHIKLHRKFKFEISEVLENIDNFSNQKLKDEVLDFLVNWLVKHIKETDQSYSNYMKKAGI